jgi:membrane-associated protein
MDELWNKVREIFRKVFQGENPLGFLNPDVWKGVLSEPGVFWPALIVLNIIIFTETGLLIGFLLPGDSLLVVVGFVARESEWNLPLLIGSLCVSAIVGDTVGYWIGAKAGPKIFSRPDGRFFKQSYIQSAKDFYEKHGGKTIIMARFVPIIRTFAPVVAGAAKMQYRTFLMYNIVGGILWVTSMILFGYFLIQLIDPVLQPVFGAEFTIAKHIDKLALVIIAVSFGPIAWKAFRSWRASKSVVVGS